MINAIEHTGRAKSNNTLFACWIIPTSKDVLVEFAAPQGGLTVPVAGITLPSTAGKFKLFKKKTLTYL